MQCRCVPDGGGQIKILLCLTADGKELYVLRGVGEKRTSSCQRGPLQGDISASSLACHWEGPSMTRHQMYPAKLREKKRTKNQKSKEAVIFRALSVAEPSPRHTTWFSMKTRIQAGDLDVPVARRFLRSDPLFRHVQTKHKARMLKDGTLRDFTVDEQMKFQFKLAKRTEEYITKRRERRQGSSMELQIAENERGTLRSVTQAP